MSGVRARRENELVELGEVFAIPMVEQTPGMAPGHAGSPQDGYFAAGVCGGFRSSSAAVPLGEDAPGVQHRCTIRARGGVPEGDIHDGIRLGGRPGDCASRGADAHGRSGTRQDCPRWCGRTRIRGETDRAGEPRCGGTPARGGDPGRHRTLGRGGIRRLERCRAGIRSFERCCAGIRLCDRCCAGIRLCGRPVAGRGGGSRSRRVPVRGDGTDSPAVAVADPPRPVDRTPSAPHPRHQPGHGGWPTRSDPPGRR